MTVDKTVLWTVVGAGPAGILAVGRLLDAGVVPAAILWLDPEFTVGDVGKYWFSVPSNTRVAFFNQFLRATQAFNYVACPAEYTLAHLHEDDTCLLSEVVKPLQWITQVLCALVPYQKCIVKSLRQVAGHWLLQTTLNVVSSKNIILAVGSVPKTLSYEATANEIALSTALNPALLKKKVTPGEHVVLFGSSHSAILAMKNLVEAACRVTNFYRSPLRYALYQPDHIIYDNTGLKGSAACWAQENLQGQPKFQTYLKRQRIVDGVEKEISAALQTCTHVIYATGFVARQLFSPDLDCRQYDPHTGILARGLFGLGIAYPEAMVDRYGIREWSVGLFKFSHYLTKVLPLWLRYTNF